jgi:hypothetical protein
MPIEMTPDRAPHTLNSRIEDIGAAVRRTPHRARGALSSALTTAAHRFAKSSAVLAGVRGRKAWSRLPQWDPLARVSLR